MTEKDAIKDLARYFLKTGQVETMAEGILTAKAGLEFLMDCKEKGLSFEDAQSLADQIAEDLDGDQEDDYGYGGDWWKNGKSE